MLHIRIVNTQKILTRFVKLYQEEHT
jgi:hypothetical protein